MDGCPHPSPSLHPSTAPCLPSTAPCLLPTPIATMLLMWQGILGHDAIVDQFRDTLARGRLASSYLFVGPEGIGKRTFALRLAESLLCQSHAERQTHHEKDGQRRPMQPCGQCESCRLMASGNHPDLDELSLPEGKQSLPIKLFIGDRAHRNQAGLCYRIAMRPMLGHRRVAIIDDADYLQQESANCLLKTLEEPPPGAVLILIGTSRGRQLPTILSRTQVVRFPPLSEEDVSQLLQRQKIAPDEAALLAAVSEGSLSVASQYAQGQLAQMRERLLPQLAPDRFRSVPLAEEISQFINEEKEAQLRRQRLQAIIRLVTGHFRGQLRAICEATAVENAFSGRPAGREGAMLVTAEQALAILQRCIDADGQVQRNANQATLLASWLDDLATVLAAP